MDYHRKHVGVLFARRTMDICTPRSSFEVIYLINMIHIIEQRRKKL